MFISGFPKAQIDKEMDLLRPIGPQDLYKMDYSKNFTNDNRYWRADGYSNAIGKYNRGECKNECEDIFSGDAVKISKCKAVCRDKCKLTGTCAFHPSESMFGSPAAPAVDPTQPSTNKSASSPNAAAGEKPKTMLWVGVSIAVIAVGIGAYIIYKKRKNG